MTAALLVITDGRGEYLERTVASANEKLHGPIVERWMYDDSGDDDHRAWLRERFPEFEHFDVGPRQGFGGAIRASWNKLIGYSKAKWVCHLEADFTFNRHVDLLALGGLLNAHPRLAQIALLRQPWNADERAAGGIWQQHPDDYTRQEWQGHQWLEHRRFVTTNPCLYPAWLMRRGWPDCLQSEGHFGISLFEDPRRYTVGFWGDGSEWVTHIGHERVGEGY
jgi:hypothetical protein